MKPKKKTSLKDIANQLGVSPTLVSMVLNHRGDEKKVSAETQKKVWNLVKKLNYKKRLQLVLLKNCKVKWQD